MKRSDHLPFTSNLTTLTLAKHGNISYYPYMSKVYARARSKQEYDSQISSRLVGDKLEDGPLYNLIARNKGAGPEAYLMSVYLQDVRRSIAGLSLRVFFTDADLRPIDSLPSTAHNHFWRPKYPLALNTKYGRCVTSIGYFLPYTDVLNDDLRAATTALSQLV